MGVSRRWVEASLVGLAGVYGFSHGIVDFRDNAPSEVLARPCHVNAEGARFDSPTPLLHLLPKSSSAIPLQHSMASFVE